MGQTRKPLVFLLVATCTTLFFVLWYRSNTKSTSPNSVTTEPPILEPSSPYLPTPSPTPPPTAIPLLPWQKIGNDIDGEASGDNSGSSVSLSSDGKTVAIGAIRSGHVRIFQWTESTSAWTQMGADIDGEASYLDNSGQSVSLSSDGKTVAIGHNSSKRPNFLIY